MVAGLGAWRATQTIYRFDPDFAAALVDTPISRLPVEAFYRLPEWCVYIEAATTSPPPVGKLVRGFFLPSAHWYITTRTNPPAQLIVACQLKQNGKKQPTVAF